MYLDQTNACKAPIPISLVTRTRFTRYPFIETGTSLQYQWALVRMNANIVLDMNYAKLLKKKKSSQQ